jgi:hypothetical protein
MSTLIFFCYLLWIDKKHIKKLVIIYDIIKNIMVLNNNKIIKNVIIIALDFFIIFYYFFMTFHDSMLTNS